MREGGLFLEYELSNTSGFCVLVVDAGGKLPWVHASFNIVMGTPARKESGAVISLAEDAGGQPGQLRNLTAG